VIVRGFGKDAGKTIIHDDGSADEGGICYGVATGDAEGAASRDRAVMESNMPSGICLMDWFTGLPRAASWVGHGRPDFRFMA